ncbi:MAG: prohibitin family protein [Brevinematales bacterium]|nr:prohibitin family protein [Brevinematales bacterium]
MMKFLISILLIIISIILFVKPFKKLGRLFSIFVFSVGLVLLLISTVIVIPAGYTGIYIFLGHVSDRTLKSGVNFVPPYVKIVYFPTRLQELTLADSNIVNARTQNGLTISLDCTTLYKINEAMAPKIYSLYATSLNELLNKIILPIIRTEIRNVISKYKAEEIYSSKREEIAKEIEKILIEKLSEKGVVIDSFLIRAILLPQEVEDAIQMKLKAQQEAEAMEFKKQKAEEEARIKVIEAKGLAEAQRIINSTLTPYYIQLEAIQVYKNLANSSNATFIIMPTSPNATGLPLIINGAR